jgi:phosphatidylserine/phosphatidylglycerophosphate/cardiolipin synthase-like enzyme
VKGALQTLDIAIYDFRLSGPEAQIVINVLNERADLGVNIRVAYFEPPKKEQPRTDSSSFIPSAGDPMPGPDKQFLGRLSYPRITVKPVTMADIESLANAVDTRPVKGGGHLMHSKYAICDGASPNAAVWTGSANYTTDAWSIQDNNIVIVRSQDLASFYVTDFAELWAAGQIKGTGKNDSGQADVGGDEVKVAFAPGEGSAVDHLMLPQSRALTSKFTRVRVKSRHSEAVAKRFCCASN